MPINTERIEKTESKNTEEERKRASMIVWGEVENKNGEKIFEAYRFLEGYELTARGAAEATSKVLGDEVKKGTQTPSLAFGYKFMDQFILEKITEMVIKY